VIFRSQLHVRESHGELKSAFDAIAEVQQKASVMDWFVTQPDHARISGELAVALDPSKVANLNDFVVQAIGMHDVGWMPLDGDASMPRQPKSLPSGIAISFVNCEPEQFLGAWLGSIQAAQGTGLLGGLLVSAHFARLAHPYLDSGRGTLEQRLMVEQFLERETVRIERLRPKAGLPAEQIDALVDVLRLCDLVSLYWCANPQAPVEVPLVLNGSTVQLSYEHGCYRMKPSLLCDVLEIEVPCLRCVAGKFERQSVKFKVQ
jgi:uncharacterized protein DUF3891